MLLDLGELEARLDGLARLLQGYRALAASPDITPEERAELAEGIAKCEAEMALAKAALEAAKALFSSGYPEHRPETASQGVIDALKRLADNVALVPKDFAPPAVLADALGVSVG